MLSTTSGTTYGAVLIGSLCASLFSGMLSIQCFIYSRMYTRDSVGMKIYIALIWHGTPPSLLSHLAVDKSRSNRFFDTLHNVAVWTSMWTWFVADFGTPERLDEIPTGISLSVGATGILTVLVHGFYAYRIYNLSSAKYRLVVTIPIIILALLRISFSFTTVHLMLKVPSLVNFKARYRWIFSLGLVFSSVDDILITVAMMVILQGTRSASLSLDAVINSLILYTLENGALTSAAAVTTMICWLVMDNLIFLAFHIIIGKLYANSVLALLNSRQALRRQTAFEHTDPTSPRVNDFRSLAGPAAIGRGVVVLNQMKSTHKSHTNTKAAMEVNVERSVEFRVEA
ncbi:hypothetical protein E1B28_009658 [Marasmius oreades]|uniref:DUF6534 domain-containing protein n=1 Tax=Marasmius oreades TaxID=181124 RepID=A0A9P7RVI0_9AGAR|nr:uncharacterized protein E1B28_009658 [Marasmius oreades]KAG7090549.1 hypothetical protein E1B28_009658 [Marasmius oreades]